MVKWSIGLASASQGHILAANGGDGRITEISAEDTQIATKVLDNTGDPADAGTLFGLIFTPDHGVYFVDNGSNTLNLLH